MESNPTQFRGDPNMGSYRMGAEPSIPQSRYGEQDLPGNPNMRLQENQTSIPLGPNPTQGEIGMAQTDNHIGMIRAGFGMGIAALLLIVIAIILYLAFGLYNRGTEEQIKNIINDSSDVDANFKDLTVQDNTTLGSNSSDTLTVNAQVSSSLIPSSDRGSNLGSATQRWDNLYIDQVVFDNGTSIITDTQDLVHIDGDLGYRRKISTITAQGLSGSGGTQILNTAQSGYLFVVEEDTGSQYTFEVKLPPATGSGVFYDFSTGSSLGTDGNDSFYINCVDSGDNFIGGLQLSSLQETANAIGVADETVVFHADSATSNLLAINTEVPVPSDTGVLRGSTLRVTDYDDNLWLIEGNLILNPGTSIPAMVNPFLAV